MIKIADLKHKVSLCSAKDIVVDGKMHMVREGVTSAWACVVPKRASTFAPDGYATKETRLARTHLIYIRFRTDLDISSLAWLFEKRLKSGDRWFKIIDMNDKAEDGQFFEFHCTLVNRGEELTQPVPQGAAPAQGLNLAKPSNVL